MAVSTTTVATGTVFVVIVGQWSKGSLVPIKVIVGGTVYILLMSFFDEANPQLAHLFGILVLVTALFLYAVPIFQGLGLLDGGKRGRRTAPNRRRGQG